MLVPVGPFSYRVELVDRIIDDEGDECMGVCDARRHVILIARHLPLPQRLATFWHELGHAWWAVLNITDRPIDEESAANLIGLAMAHTSIEDIVRVVGYLHTEHDGDHVILHGLPHPVPWLRYVASS